MSILSDVRRGWKEKGLVYGVLGVVCAIPLIGVGLRATGRVTRTDPAASAASTTSGVALEAGPRDALVILYAKDACPACDQTRAWFDARHLDYEERDIDDDPRARAELLQVSPDGTVPALRVGNETLVGYDPAAIESAVARAVARRRFR